MVSPTVRVRFEQPFRGEQATAASQLALTTAAWVGVDGGEPWRLLSVPLQGVPRRGVPDPSRPWVVALGRDGHAPAAALNGAQIHLLGGMAPTNGSWVRWPRTPRAAAALLGRAERVIGRGDPVVYDAVRLGVPVYDWSGEQQDQRVRKSLNLAGTIPAPLLGDADLWRYVIEVARWVRQHQASPPPLFTGEWVTLAREKNRRKNGGAVGAWEQMLRRYDKLVRDPIKFFADSRFPRLRSWGEKRYSRPPPPPPGA